MSPRHWQRPLYILITILSWLLPGQASFGLTGYTCSHLFAPESFLPVPIQVRSRWFINKDYGTIAQYSVNLNQLLGPLGLTRIEVVQSSGINGGAASWTGTIWIPSLQDSKFRGMTFESATQIQRAIFDHEFGHLVFDENLIVEISGVKATFLQHTRQEGVMYTYQSRNETLSNLWKLRMPYNELFADLIAVLEIGDGRAVADSFGFSNSRPYTCTAENSYQGRLANPDGPRPRDFTEVTSFKNWNHERKEVDDYTLLDPVRGALWRKYVKPGMSAKEAQNLLRAFLNATATHLERRVARVERGDSSETPTTINQEFFRLLTDELRK